MSVKTRYAIALTVLLLVATTSARAIEQVAMQIGVWSSEQLTIQDLQLEVNLLTSGLAVTATAKTVQLAEPFGRLSNVRLRCDKLRWWSDQIDCLQGQLDFSHPQWGSQQVAFEVQALAAAENYKITLSGIRIDQGRLNAQATYQQGQWQAQLTGQQIELSSLLHLISSSINERQLNHISQWNLSATADIDAVVNGQQQQLKSATVSSTLNNLTFSDPSGRYVGEQLAADLQLELTVDAGDGAWQQTLTVRDGQAYFEPVFLDLAEQAVMIRSDGQFGFKEKQWQINNLWFEQGETLKASGRLQGQMAELQSLDIDISSTDLSILYGNWLQPFFPGSSFGQLRTSGEASANIQWQAEHYQFSLDLQSVSLEDDGGRFSVTDLNGLIGWSDYAAVLPIALNWQSASVFAVPLGGSRLMAEVSQDQIRFTESLSLPILDGELSINDLQMSLTAPQGLRWQFQGLLSPISMDQLSHVLGWPVLQGKLSGMIPKVSYADEAITVDGALLLKIFDGTTVIRNLRLQQPFGSLPQLYADIDISRLDLQTLTSTFDFGNISGKLDGRIHNLRLSDWQPVQFDALFETPDKEPGKRRISQRAVNNLSQVGGGPTAILSRGFMGIFEDFSYQKLGLSCRLMNSVCQMDGVEATEQGYYIVKGGGLPPWINVVGHTREVDWPELIARLKAVSQSDGPVIQ